MPEERLRMIDQTVSHYTIVEKLGEGGMGIVYKAHDTKLDRCVAIKFLSARHAVTEQDKTRFIHEARAASALEHSNICAIYEIDETSDGQLFLVMPCYEGTPLNEKIEKGPLLVNEAIDIAIQIADGLHAAHEKGIVHRDIKSSNIFITSKGQVKVMDFGLARSAGMTQLTRTGITVGTVPFMSPEQVRGDQVDHQTDIWSFGVVLYEMITGRMPFRGGYNEAILYQILNEDPEPISNLRPDIPVELERIVMKAMHKEPGERYQEIDEILTDLTLRKEEPETGGIKKSLRGINGSKRRKVLPLAGFIMFMAIAFILFISSPVRQVVFDAMSKKEIPSDIHLAVLPFTTISDRPDDQNFSNGLMGILTSKMTQLELEYSSFWIVPSSEIWSRGITSASEARRTFGVTAVIDGSVYRDAQDIHIMLNLIDGRTLRQLGSWNTVIDRKNLTEISDAMSVQIARMLNMEFQPQEKRILERGGTKDSRAYELYIEAEGLFQRYDRLENVSEAIDKFSAAIEIDAKFTLAYAGRGKAYWRLYELTKDPDWIDHAIKNSKYSIHLDEAVPSAYVTLGIIQRGTGRYEESVESLRKALEIEPVNHRTLNELARSLELLEKFDEAELLYKQAIELRPTYWGTYNRLGGFYIRRGEFAEAIGQYSKVIGLTPDNIFGYINLGGTYYYMGKTEDARKNFERALEIAPDYSAASNLGTIYFCEGRYTEAARMYEKALSMMDRDYVLWGNLGSAYYWAPGERDNARDAYLRAIELGGISRDINPRNAGIIIDLANYHAMIGDREAALSYIEEALLIAPDDMNVLFRAGTAYENLGERDKALSLIEYAIRSGYPLSDILPQPGLAELIDDERFENILQNM